MDRQMMRFITFVFLIFISTGLKCRSERAECPPKPEAPPPEDFSEIVEDEIRKLTPGLILFNPPKEMKVGVKERVEVRIAKTFTDNLSAGLRGRGELQIEEIQVGSFMKVCLRGDDFDINALSHEGQVVVGERFTQWDWDVRPLKGGRRSLLLTVTVRIVVANIEEQKKDYPVFERYVDVKVNPIYSVKKFIGNYWQWIITTIISSCLIIIGWIVKKRSKSVEKKRSESN